MISAIPILIVIILLVVIIIVIVVVWCLVKRNKRKRSRKVAPSKDSPTDSPPTMFGSFGQMKAPLIVPPRRHGTPKRVYSPDLSRRTVSHRVEAPHIIHLPGDEVIPAGSTTRYMGGAQHNESRA